MKNLHDRFGVPEENLQALFKWKGKKRKRYPFHLYVPTRKEVATLSPAELKSILTGWMCHSPVEIIPSRSQIAEVRSVLLERKDSAAFTELLEMCRNYISYS
jgi:hypothetical protein